MTDKKWCPFSQVSAGNIEAMLTNRGSIFAMDAGLASGEVRQLLAGDASCMEEHCAAWRWVMVSDSASGAVINHDGSLDWLGRPPRGYCGLAGKP